MDDPRHMDESRRTNEPRRSEIARHFGAAALRREVRVRYRADAAASAPRRVTRGSPVWQAVFAPLPQAPGPKYRPADAWASMVELTGRGRVWCVCALYVLGEGAGRRAAVLWGCVHLSRRVAVTEENEKEHASWWGDVDTPSAARELYRYWGGDASVASVVVGRATGPAFWTPRMGYCEIKNYAYSTNDQRPCGACNPKPLAVWGSCGGDDTEAALPISRWACRERNLRADGRMRSISQAEYCRGPFPIIVTRVTADGGRSPPENAWPYHGTPLGLRVRRTGGYAPPARLADGRAHYADAFRFAAATALLGRRAAAALRFTYESST